MKKNKNLIKVMTIIILGALMAVSCSTTKSSVTGEGVFFQSALIREEQQEYHSAIVLYATAVEEMEIEVERFNEEVDRIGLSLPEKEYRIALRNAIKIIEELQIRNSENTTYVTFYESIKFILELKL